MEKAIERLLVAAMRGETGRVIDRWQVTSLAELRDAIDAATQLVTDAGGADIGLGPIDVVLAHFPRGEDGVGEGGAALTLVPDAPAQTSRC